MQLVVGDAAFGAILKQGVAQDLFDDFIDELEEAFRREYKRIKQALERIGFRMALGLGQGRLAGAARRPSSGSGLGPSPGVFGHSGAENGDSKPGNGELLRFPTQVEPQIHGIIDAEADNSTAMLCIICSK